MCRDVDLFETGGVVGPAFKTRGVVDPKNEKDGGTDCRAQD